MKEALPTILVALVLAVIVVLIVRKMIRNRKAESEDTGWL